MVLDTAISKSTPSSVSDKNSLDNARLHRPLFWKKQIQICEQKHLIRSVHQRRCNPDYKIAHPAECRGHSEGTGLTVHPEARERILKELANKIKSVNPPPVDRPPRYNRS